MWVAYEANICKVSAHNSTQDSERKILEKYSIELGKIGYLKILKGLSKCTIFTNFWPFHQRFERPIGHIINPNFPLMSPHRNLQKKRIKPIHQTGYK